MSHNQKQKQHRREVWDKFWKRNQQIDQVYSNSDRVLVQLHNLGELSGKKILEVGAGSGRDGVALYKDGAHIFMLDYSEPALRVIQKLAMQGEETINLIRGDAFHLPLKTECLDIVFHQGLLEHFINPIEILAENYRVLRPGGFALADVPQRYHIYTLIKHILILLKKWFAGWETEFSLQQLKNLFLIAGFQVYDAYGDWMRPSFIYRMLREILKKIRVRIPLYPTPMPGVSAIRSFVRNLFRRHRIFYYTYMDIGVIGKKNAKKGLITRRA